MKLTADDLLALRGVEVAEYGRKMPEVTAGYAPRFRFEQAVDIT